MGFLDKAKDMFSNAADRLKDPDKNLVEHAWPMGEADDEHLPDGPHDPEAHDQPTQPVRGADPELDDSVEDQYDEDPDEDAGEPR